MSTEPLAELLFSPSPPVMEVDYSQIPEELEIEPLNIKGDVPSVEERIESYVLPLTLQIQLSKISSEAWRELFTCLPLLHPAILALRFPVPESYQAHCPSSVGLGTENGVILNWIGLFQSIPNPLPQTVETDRLRNCHGHFLSNVRKLRVYSDYIKRVENGEIRRVEDENGEVSALARILKEEDFMQFCVGSAEALLEEMVALLPVIYNTTQELRQSAEKAAYREHQRSVASEAEAPEFRDHRYINLRILNLEYPIPAFYQPHFAEEHNARGIIDHYLQFVGYTPEPRGYEREARASWRTYRACESEIRTEKNKLFIISDAIEELEDPRFWLYGDDDSTPPPPQDTKEELINECLEETKQVLSTMVAAFPRTREASLRVHRAYRVEQDGPIFPHHRHASLARVQVDAERRSRAGLRRQRLSREAELREEEENESPYLVMLRLRQRYIEWHAGRGPNPALFLLHSERFREAPTRRDLLPRDEYQTGRGEVEEVVDYATYVLERARETIARLQSLQGWQAQLANEVDLE
ncbi:hypothetical protein E2P81_ATG03503 [Venturia nashicola]|nr:hypothetical protein E2P81_ATG03503 [Venturia nashicola]